MNRIKQLINLFIVNLIALTGCKTSDESSSASFCFHSFGDPVVENNVAPTCTEEGGYDLVAYCSICHEEISRTHEVAEPLGHDYDVPLYTWSDDNSICVATCICKNDDSHIITEIINSTVTITQEASETLPELSDYVALFTNNIFTEQMKKNVQTKAPTKVDSTTPISSIWNGKTINVIGDSIVEGLSGDFVSVIKDELGFATANNYGIGGSRMAYCGDEGLHISPDRSIVERIDAMSNADVVVVLAGTNDWASQVPLGDSNSVNKTEFNGALNIIMNTLRDNYPTSLIVFCTILDRVGYDASIYGGKQMDILTSSYNQAIKDRCEEHHILCYDLHYYSGLDFQYDYYHEKIISDDGLHPNSVGAAIIGRKIAGFINSN